LIIVDSSGLAAVGRVEIKRPLAGGYSKPTPDSFGEGQAVHFALAVLHPLDHRLFSISPHVCQQVVNGL
jgi:hypothetical protein